MVLSRKTIYNGSVGPSDAVYHLISSTFSDSAVLWITGRSAQKIRLLIFKIAKTAETLATPTTAQKWVVISIEHYG
jgi:hypothetical protein